MHISNKMIHKELRFWGIVIRTFLRFKIEKTFVRFQKIIDKKIVGR